MNFVQIMKFPWRHLFVDALDLGGQVFTSYLSLRLQQRLPLPKMRHIQDRDIELSLHHASREVEFYRQVLSKGPKFLGDDPPIRLNCFPIIDRVVLTDHWDQFVASDAQRYSPKPRRTSGTTGKPLTILLDGRTWAMNAALMLIRMEWAGCEPGDRTVVFNAPLGYFGGCKIDYNSPYLFDPRRKTLILNGARLTDERMRHFAFILRDYKPDTLRGFPSTLVLLARSLVREKIKIRLRAVLTGGELVLDWQRKLLTETFGCRVFDFYGMWESVAGAAQCEQGSYHLLPGLGFVEIVNGGQPCGPGEVGELVGTHVSNYSMPLIRYNTHDLAAWTGKQCACGKQLPTLSVIGGRGRDFLVTKTGYCVVPAGLPARFVPPLPIEKLQFHQEKKGEALIRIVRGAGYAPEHTQALLDALLREVGDSIAFSWEYIDDIPRGPSGKYQFVVSNVPFDL